MPIVVVDYAYVGHDQEVDAAIGLIRERSSTGGSSFVVSSSHEHAVQFLASAAAGGHAVSDAEWDWLRANRKARVVLAVAVVEGRSLQPVG